MAIKRSPKSFSLDHELIEKIDQLPRTINISRVVEELLVGWFNKQKFD